MSPLPRYAAYAAGLLTFALIVSGCGDEKTIIKKRAAGSPPPAPTGLTASSPGS